MRWFHTVALALGTIFAVWVSVRRRAALWKPAALVCGGGLMVSGVWAPEGWSTLLLLAGCAAVVVAVPRGPSAPAAPAPGIARSAVAAREPGAGGLAVSFPSPRFMLGDARVVLRLDGAVIHEGSFRTGIDVSVPAAPGRHGLEAVIELGIGRRRRSWDLDVPPSGCAVQLVYSRFWGNFARGVRVDSPARAAPTAGA